MSVKSVGAKEAIEGRALAQSLEKMVDFKSYVERARRRLAGDANLLEVLLETLAGRKGLVAKRRPDAAQGFPGWGSDAEDRQRAQQSRI